MGRVVRPIKAESTCIGGRQLSLRFLPLSPEAYAAAIGSNSAPLTISKLLRAPKNVAVYWAPMDRDVDEELVCITSTSVSVGVQAHANWRISSILSPRNHIH